MNSNDSPDNIIDQNDPGDDVQRRFRYQSQVAALMSLKLLDDESNIECIYCEQYEDILIKYNDKDFKGIQVKTRDHGLGPLYANSQDVIKSIKRFIDIEKKFPEYFSKFVLATNDFFWVQRKNYRNIRFLADSAKDTIRKKPEKIDSNLAKFIKNFSEDGTIGLNVLSKMELWDELPKFDDMERFLGNEIRMRYPRAMDSQYFELKRATNSLTSKMLEAASLGRELNIDYYFSHLEDPKETEVSAILQGKRITKNIVESVLRESLSSTSMLIASDYVPIKDLPSGIRNMAKKMAMGGITTSNIDLANDYKASAEVLLIGWENKYGSTKATERYQHLTTAVRTICQESFDKSVKDDEYFGPKMLQEVRERLHDRHEKNLGSNFNCEYEHLLGIAGILTENCKVWWSKEFNIQEET